jgi:hypothetical protein
MTLYDDAMCARCRSTPPSPTDGDGLCAWCRIVYESQRLSRDLPDDRPLPAVEALAQQGGELAPCYRCGASAPPFHAAVVKVPLVLTDGWRLLQDGIRITDLRACSPCVNVAAATPRTVKLAGWESITKALRGVGVLVGDGPAARDAVVLQWEHVPRFGAQPDGRTDR